MKMPDDIQTITYDDFEQSLREDNIPIIVPEEESEQPDGTGAVGFYPRLAAPTATNPYYLKYGRGGYNRCLLITGNSCLPNCVGYAYGRTLEIGGKTENAKLPTCNAEDWLSVSKNNGLETGTVPKVGAVIVWKSGRLWNGNDGCGHVGIVESVSADGSITVSQSNYGGTRFFLTKHKPPYNIAGQTFIGFIYNEYLAEEGWVKDDTGWWYKYSDGSYPVSCWKFINKKWYYFDAKGYMKTGWVKYRDHWYYCGKDGAMLENRWVKWNGAWYYVGKDGMMLTGNQTVPVHFNESGAFDGTPRK